MSHSFSKRSSLPVPARDALAWHFRPGAFDRLAPPWQPVEVVGPDPVVREGARTTLRPGFGPLRFDWVAEHRDVRPDRGFRDVQISGPFASWDHLHRIEKDGSAASVLEDSIEYEAPFGGLGELFGAPVIARELQRLFAFRHRVTRDDLATHARYPGEPMKIAATGTSGLVGSSLVPFLTTGGHHVRRLVRRPPRDESLEFRWDPRGSVDPRGIEGVDAVVHLAGENIGDGRWTREKKERLWHSRVDGTRTLSTALAKLERPPRVLVCASAVGHYGDRGDEPLDEGSGPGEGFLSELSQAWEAASQPAADAGIRVVHLRLGVILDPRGGALAKMLTPFKLGAGGRIGSGRQWMSWTALEDVVDAFHHALTTEELSGALNVVAPEPVTNAELTRALGRVLGRPTVAAVPAFAARLAFGEMADALLLASTRVSPARLIETGFSFRHPRLDGALRHVLGRSAA